MLQYTCKSCLNCCRGSNDRINEHWLAWRGGSESLCICIMRLNTCDFRRFLWLLFCLYLLDSTPLYWGQLCPWQCFCFLSSFVCLVEVFNERFPKQSCAETRQQGLPFVLSNLRRTFMSFWLTFILSLQPDLLRYADDMVKSKLDPFWCSRAEK